jgi:CheY-like chemotaxis protein
LSLAPPDLLMADLRLGAYNGLHLVHRLRLMHADIPAILKDDASDPVLEREALNAQALYLVKPVTPSALVVAARRLLAGRPINPATEAARRWQRRNARMSATLQDREGQIVDWSYGGARLEISSFEGGTPNRPVEMSLPELGSIPVRVVWTKAGGALGPGWCGLEVVDQRAAQAWRGYLNSLHPMN